MKFVFTKPIKITAIAILALLLAGGATTGIILGLKNAKDEEKPGPEPTPESNPIQITETMFTAPQALPNLHYNLDSQELISAGQTEYGTFMYKLGEADWNPTTPLGEFGSYEVKWYIDAIDGYLDYGSKEQPYSISASIEKGVLSEAQFVSPKAKEGLSYTGENQKLITEGSVITEECGTFMYSLDKTIWSADVPEACEPSSYQIYWYIKGTDKYENYKSESEPESVVVNISKAEIHTEQFTAPKAKTLGYLGTSQELIEAGSSEFGTFYYSKNKKDWSTNIPTEINVGDYTVYWYISGDAHHNDYGSKEQPFSITVSIGLGDSSLFITKFPHAINEILYDSEEHDLIVFGEATNPLCGGRFFYTLDKDDFPGGEDTMVSATDIGEYTVYWYFDADLPFFNDFGSVENPNSFKAYISAKELEIGTNYIPPMGKFFEDIVYDGEAHELIYPANTEFGEPVELESTDVGETYYSLDKIHWSKEVPTATKIGSYTVYWYCESTAVFAGLYSVDDPQGIPAEITFAYPEPAEGLVQNGEVQTLITAGNCGDYGVFMYRIEGEEEYSPELPSVAITEDMYYVEFYIKGNEGNEDLGSPNMPYGIMAFHK